MQSANLITCKDCAKWAFARWRGWFPTSNAHATEALPHLPLMIGGECQRCGCQEPLLLDHVIYQNYHSPYSTGLPDYFYLEICSTPQSRRRHGSMFLELPYMQANVNRIPLEILDGAKLLSEEWNETQKRLQLMRRERAKGQQVQRDASDARREARLEGALMHQVRSNGANIERSELIAKFKSMSVSQRAKAIIIEWSLPLHAYPLTELPLSGGIRTLKIEDRVALSAKISGMRGEWQILKKSIDSI